MTITLCAYNRPDYLQRVLASLDTALIACPEYARESTVWIGIDLGGDQERLVHEAADAWDVLTPWQTYIVRWPQHLGVSEAPRRLLQHVFTERQSPYNVHLEDDTVLSPDALRLAYWHYSSLERQMSDTFLSLHSSAAADHPAAADACAGAVVWRPDFGVWGWGCSNLMWRLWLSQRWNEKLTEPLGWDWAASRMMRRHELWAVQPVLSRVRNIGRLGGTHATPESHDAEQAHAIAAGPDQMCDIADFRLVSPPSGRVAREAWKHGD